MNWEAQQKGFLLPNWSVGVDCRLCLSVVVIGCRLSSAQCKLLGVAVGGCCWFLVDCRLSHCRCSLLIPDGRVSLSVVVAGSWLPGVAVSGRFWFLVVGCRCRWSLLVPGCRVSVVVASSLLSGVAVGG